VCCSIQLREAQKETDKMTHLYIEECSSVEKLKGTLECERRANKDLATLLDITKKLRMVQADLKTERQKVSVAVVVLNIATTTDRLCGETLIDMQLINIALSIEDSSLCTQKSTI